MKKGLFISVEGIEGAGKSTVIDTLTKLMDSYGLKNIVTREPGGTPLAEDLRALLLVNREEKVEPITELLLMYAARSQHLSQVIEPALASGISVICDRFNDSTFAYQGGGRGMDEQLIKSIDQITLANFRPDLILLLDLDVEIGLERATKRGEKDRFESESLDFFNRVRKSFIDRAKLDPKRYQIIDASLSEIQVKENIQNTLEVCLKLEGCI